MRTMDDVASKEKSCSHNIESDRKCTILTGLQHLPTHKKIGAKKFWLGFAQI